MKRIKLVTVIAAICMTCALFAGCGSEASGNAGSTAGAGSAVSTGSKSELWTLLSSSTIVELSREVSKDTPHQADFPELKVTPVLTHEDDDCYSNSYDICSQYGTHIDVPIHFFKDGKTLDEYDAKELIMPLCVIDVSEKVAGNADYVITMDDVNAYEEKYGQIPEKAFVAMRTDWSKGRDTMEDLENVDSEGQAHYPGWSLEVVEFLCNERNISAIGHEPGDTDPGLTAVSGGWAVEAAFLETGRFQVEMMCNLDQVPEAGATIILGFPKVVDAGGFPVRAIAICPAE